MAEPAALASGHQALVLISVPGWAVAVPGADEPKLLAMLCRNEERSGEELDPLELPVLPPAAATSEEKSCCNCDSWLLPATWLGSLSSEARFCRLLAKLP
jgi:hypothetical protein